ncbi:MAG TPA: hypothetical protein VGE18_01400 [Candidatus Paceibacterota bacterium]
MNLITKITPASFRKRDFVGSALRSSEAETISENIIFIQQKLNEDAWTPFTWEDYKSLCRHLVTESELGVLEALVNGGKPVPRTTVVLKSGYLTKNDSGQYQITEQFLQTLEKFTN